MAACPRSPEGGYHRFKLPASGAVFLTHCVYCAQPKVLRPFAADDLPEEALRLRRRRRHTAVVGAVRAPDLVPFPIASDR